MNFRLIGVLMTLAATSPLMGQGKGTNAAGVPPGHLPPAGMCRIWIDGVPPGKQPAPTDCNTAIARRPANARVLFGNDTPFPGQGKGKTDSRAECLDRNTGTIAGIPIPLPRDPELERACRARKGSTDGTLDRDVDSRWPLGAATKGELKSNGISGAANAKGKAKAQAKGQGKAKGKGGG
jgi:hypothetical protein